MAAKKQTKAQQTNDATAQAVEPTPIATAPAVAEPSMMDMLASAMAEGQASEPKKAKAKKAKKDDAKDDAEDIPSRKPGSAYNAVMVYMDNSAKVQARLADLEVSIPALEALPDVAKATLGTAIQDAKDEADKLRLWVQNNPEPAYTEYGQAQEELARRMAEMADTLDRYRARHGQITAIMERMKAEAEARLDVLDEEDD